MTQERATPVMRLLIKVVLLISLAGCEENSVSVVSAFLDQEFSLKVGQQASVRGENVAITFLAVTEDSRCPKGADCIWVGNGRVVLELRKNGSSATSAELNTFLEPRRVLYLDYQIHLISLVPYPRVDARIDPSDYAATLMVTR
jgi:hypothetical protein